MPTVNSWTGLSLSWKDGKKRYSTVKNKEKNVPFPAPLQSYLFTKNILGKTQEKGISWTLKFNVYSGVGYAFGALSFLFVRTPSKSHARLLLCCDTFIQLNQYNMFFLVSMAVHSCFFVVCV